MLNFGDRTRTGVFIVVPAAQPHSIRRAALHRVGFLAEVARPLPVARRVSHVVFSTCEVLCIGRPCRHPSVKRVPVAPIGSLFPSPETAHPSDRPPTSEEAGFILPWSLPLRRTLASYPALPFPASRSLSELLSSRRSRPKPTPLLGRHCSGVCTLHHSTSMLVASRFPPCRSVWPLTEQARLPRRPPSTSRF